MASAWEDDAATIAGGMRALGVSDATGDAPPGSRLGSGYGCSARRPADVGGASFSDPQADAVARARVDPMLIDALREGGASRMTVLRVDQEMSRFARDRSATARTFEGSSFHRLVAHKVAAHHGLLSRTSISQDGADVALVEKPAGVDAVPAPVVRLIDVAARERDASRARPASASSRDAPDAASGGGARKKVVMARRGGGDAGRGGRGGAGRGAGGDRARGASAGRRRRRGRSPSTRTRDADRARARVRARANASSAPRATIRPRLDRTARVRTARTDPRERPRRRRARDGTEGTKQKEGHLPAIERRTSPIRISIAARRDRRTARGRVPAGSPRLGGVRRRGWDVRGRVPDARGGVPDARGRLLRRPGVRARQRRRPRRRCDRWVRRWRRDGCRRRCLGRGCVPRVGWRGGSVLGVERTALARSPRRADVRSCVRRRRRACGRAPRCLRLRDESKRRRRGFVAVREDASARASPVTATRGRGAPSSSATRW